MKLYVWKSLLGNLILATIHDRYAGRLLGTIEVEPINQPSPVKVVKTAPCVEIEANHSSQGMSRVTYWMPDNAVGSAKCTYETEE